MMVSIGQGLGERGGVLTVQPPPSTRRSEYASSVHSRMDRRAWERLDSRVVTCIQLGIMHR